MTDVTLAILAGGEGRRMGMPKGLLRLEGKPILEHLLDRLAWPGPTLLVTAPGREHPPGWERFSREVVDPVPGMGPLRGVLTALENAASERVVVTTVDMPAVGRTQLDWLVGQLEPPRVGVMLSRVTAEPPPLIEPFPCAFRIAGALERVRAHLAGGARSIYSLAGKADMALVPAPAEWPARAWTNLNRPADLAEFEAG